MNDTQIAPLDNTINAQLQTFDGMERVAKTMADSKMFGINTQQQAMALMLISAAEGIHPVMALRRYHLIDGKPSMKAEAILAEYTSKTVGGVIWHIRSDEVVAATFFAEKTKIDDKATDRAILRFNKLLSLEFENSMPEKDPAKIAGLISEISKLSKDGENTIVRTMADAINKGLALTFKNNNKGELKENWFKSPRQMLTARCISEGVRLTHPQVIVGIYSEEEERDMLQDKLHTPMTKEQMEDRIKELTDAAMNMEAKDPNRSRILSEASELRQRVVAMEEAAPKQIEAPKEINTEAAATPEPSTEVNTVAAEVTVVPPPKSQTKPRVSNARPKNIEDPAPGAAEEPLAASDPMRAQSTAAVEPAAPAEGEATESWREYVSQFVALSGVKGKKIGDLTPELVNSVRIKWCDKYAENIAKSEERTIEARHFLEAYRFHKAAGAYKE